MYLLATHSALPPSSTEAFKDGGIESDPPQSACLVHCTTGNNRSGVFLGAFLSLLGMPPDEVAAEYALSDVGLAASRDTVVARLLKNPVFFKAVGGDRARVIRMVGARKESMIAMIEMVNERWGNAEGYFKTEGGVTDEEIKAIKEILIERIEVG